MSDFFPQKECLCYNITCTYFTLIASHVKQEDIVLIEIVMGNVKVGVIDLSDK